MGSGKSLLGQLLAKQLAFDFLDLDEVIESEAGCTISKIFNEKGENAFRVLEKEAVHRTSGLERTVIATGGGTPCFFDNMERMNKFGVTIYLNAPPILLANRLKREKEKRPLLAGMDEIELMSFIKNTLKRRINFYEMAQFRCDVNGPPDEIAAFLASYFKRFI